MKVLTHAVILLGVLVVVDGSPGAPTTESPAVASFPLASIHLERNATDGDMEVVFEVKGGQEGLAELIVRSPDGRRVVAFRAPDASTLGIRQFRFESPEPRDVTSLKAAYPEGVYEFIGKTSSGATLVGKSTLSHRLPPTATLVTPARAPERVSAKDLAISWGAVSGVAAYLVSIKHSELNVNLTVRLPGSSTSLAIPSGILSPGRTYKMAIGTVSPEGNISYVETTFTAGR